MKYKIQTKLEYEKRPFIRGSLFWNTHRIFKNGKNVKNILCCPHDIAPILDKKGDQLGWGCLKCHATDLIDYKLKRITKFKIKKEQKAFVIILDK